MNRIHNKLFDLNQRISARLIKEAYLGGGSNKKTLIEAFDFHNKQLKNQIGKGYAQGTYTRFETTKKHLIDFLTREYSCEDIELSDLDYGFIVKLEHYFKVTRNCNHNTTLKYIRNIRKIVNTAILNDWLAKDPFGKYKVKFKEVKRDYLTQDELTALEQKDFEIERLGQVRDVFVFCCYTGLSYADVRKLTIKDISKGLDGDLWIFIERTKTGNSSNVPVLSKALEIIKRYQNSPELQYLGKLLPILSNQKMNAYLKEIGCICGLNKNLTFHVARHTFATTVTLSNGVSIESVSSMLGHKNMRTTQIYAKVVQGKVSADMRKLKSLMSENE
ncbi:site-specific integrase [Fulvivirga maritima]|nr:site-specific integrase [Fulvivirga maritima]UII29055.1 site-specific integrase [Fulvivirga maritima]